MTRPHCSGCKFFNELRGGPVLVRYCNKPEAEIFSRIEGPHPPRLDWPNADETLKKCDQQGWFEAKEPLSLDRLLTRWLA